MVCSTILACAQLGSLEEARNMGEYIDSNEYNTDVFVKTTLIDMYAKCGSVELAREVFDQTKTKDVVDWRRWWLGGGGKWGSLVAESGEDSGWEEEVRWCDGGGKN
ncbi:pentatricopeptide repeat-containing protein [Tanacetum coccineum]